MSDRPSAAFLLGAGGRALLNEVSGKSTDTHNTEKGGESEVSSGESYLGEE